MQRDTIDCKCISHINNIGFYCPKLNIPICTACINDHKDHADQFIDDKVEKEIITNFKTSRKEFEDEIAFFNIQKNEIQKQFNETNNNMNEIVKLIAKKYEHLHTVIMREESDIKRRIGTYQKENKKFYKKKINQIEKRISLLNSKLDDDIQLVEICELKKEYYKSCKYIKPFINFIQPFNHINLLNEDNKNEDDIENDNYILETLLKNMFSINNKLLLEYSFNNKKYTFNILDNKNVYNYKDIKPHDLNLVILNGEDIDINIDNNIDNNIDINIDNNKSKNSDCESDNSINSNSKNSDSDSDSNSNGNGNGNGNNSDSNSNSNGNGNGNNSDGNGYRNIKENISDNNKNKTTQIDVPNCNRLLCYKQISNLKFNNIFNSVQTLILHNIQEILVEGLIPVVKHLYIVGYQYGLDERVIPDGVIELTLSNINEQLKNIKIPKSVKVLRLDNIKNQIENIPPVEDLRLYNVKINSIPESVTYLTLSNGFQNKLEDGLIPKSVKTLSLGNIKEPLDKDSIPNTLISISFCNGFNHHIKKEVIPNSVKTLYVYDIENPLEINSLPLTIKQIHLNGYKHQIVNGIIHENVELSLYDIEHPIDISSLPSIIKEINFKNGYKHSIQPYNAKLISLSAIEEPLIVGSISSSVTKLSFCNGYKHKIRKETIPETVECLYINNIDQELDSNSIPPSVTEVHICDGYKYKINENIFSSSIKNLVFGDIVQPLHIKSIPSNPNLHIHFGKGFKHKLNNGILPKNVTSISINSDHIKDIEEIIFPPNIKILKVYNNKIKVSYKTIKTNLPNIESIHLRKEQLELFSKEKKSKKIDLFELQ